MFGGCVRYFPVTLPDSLFFLHTAVPWEADLYRLYQLNSILSAFCVWPIKDWQSLGDRWAEGERAWGFVCITLLFCLQLVLLNLRPLFL